MIRAFNLRWAALALLAVSGSLAGTAFAATPASGTLTPTNPTLTYTSGPFTVSNPSGTGGTVMCRAPVLVCDDYALTVTVSSA